MSQDHQLSLNLARVDLRLLRAYIDVVEHGGFSAAAEASGTSLSTITRDIAALETRLGLRLCQRGRGGFAVTPEGKVVLQSARELMEHVRSFERGLEIARNTLPDALKIGIIESMIGNPECTVVETLLAARRGSSDQMVRVSVHSTNAIDHLVRDRRLDIGFTPKVGNLTPLIYEPAFEERHALFVSRSCPDFDRILNAGTGRNQRPIPYVARAFHTDLYAAIERSLPLQIQAYGSGLDGVQTAVAAGFGVGFLPIHAAAGFKDLVQLPYPVGGLSIRFNAVVRRDAAIKGAMGKLLGDLRRRAEQTLGKPQV